MNVRRAVMLIAGLMGMVYMYACGSGTEAYGEAISADSEITSMSAVLSAPENFDGKTVKIEGEIYQECPSGCWFDLKDQSAMIHVDIKPSGFAISQKVGHKAVVEGKVQKQNGQIVIIGKGVEIK